MDHVEGLVPPDQHLVRGGAVQGDILGPVIAGGRLEGAVHRLGGREVDADLGSGPVPVQGARGAVVPGGGGGGGVIPAS